jgi:hypothetical protein
MKRLILDIMVGILVLVALTLSPGQISWAGALNSDQVTYLEEDPNEPGAESWVMNNQFVYLDEDPNEPGAESWVMNNQFVYLDEDPNEPGAE